MPDQSLADAVTLAAACKMMPTPPHPATMFRWGKHGILVNGARVRLKLMRIGGRIYVRPADLTEFLSRLNPPDNDETPAESDADRLRRSREAGAALEALGC